MRRGKRYHGKDWPGKLCLVPCRRSMGLLSRQGDKCCLSRLAEDSGRHIGDGLDSKSRSIVKLPRPSSSHGKSEGPNKHSFYPVYYTYYSKSGCRTHDCREPSHRSTRQCAWRGFISGPHSFPPIERQVKGIARIDSRAEAPE